MKNFLILIFVTGFLNILHAQEKNLSDCIVMKDGVINIFASSTTVEDSFFQLSVKRSNKTVK